MKKFRQLFIATLLSCLFALPAFSQEETPAAPAEQPAASDSTRNDSTAKDDFESWGENYAGNNTFSFSSMNLKFDSPTIEFQLLESQPMWLDKHIANDFAKTRGWDLKIGYTDYKALGTSNYVIKSDFNFFHLSNIDKGFMSLKAVPNEIQSNTWNFGYACNEGYGYKYEKYADIVFYHGSGLGWTNVNFDNSTATTADMAKLKRIDNEWHYAEKFEVGAKIRLAEMISINAGYERSLVYPRHIFWYWTLSKLIEGAGQGLLSQFIDAVAEKSPYMVPVVNVVMRSALSFGLYQLRSRDMNWPLSTEPGFVFDKYKVGASFSF